jgi:hypothetical protein
MSDWNTSIIEEFRANGGKVGGQFEGALLVLVHHVGAKSGTEVQTPRLAASRSRSAGSRSLHPTAAHQGTLTGATT